MLLPHPDSPFSEKHIERMHSLNRVRAAGHLGMAALLGISPYASVYAQDVQQNIEIQQSATIDIDRLYEPLDPQNRNVAIVAIDGFGAYDAKTLAKYLGPVAQTFLDGQIWSVRYGNAFLETEAITEKIVELAEAYNVDTIGILGYSAGGIIGAQITNDLLYTTDLEVPLVFNVSTPDGPEGLRELQLQEIEVAQTIESVPGATHSSFVRYLGEMYFRRDRYDSGAPLDQAADFIETHNGVLDDLQQDTLPGTWLLIDQVNIVSNAQLEEQYRSMGAIEGKNPPTIVYFGTAKPGYDYVVDDKLSGSNICRYAYDNDMRCFRYNVPGAVHTRPDLANEAYLEMAEAIAPMVRFALQNDEVSYILRQTLE